MCAFFGVSRAAYYVWVKKLEEPDPDQERLDQVRAVYEASHKAYGYRRITIQLQKKQGLSINHKAVLRLMNQIGDPFPGQKAQNAQKVGRDWHISSLPERAQS